MHETFHMLPAGNGMVWLTAVLGVLLAGVLALLVWITAASKHVEYRVGAGRLAIQGGPYGREIALADLDLECARVLDLQAEPELKVRWKTNGAALPGLQMGWFRLRDRQKSLMFVTDRSRVLFVPTRLGWCLQLSVENPAALLASLRRART